MGWASVTDFVCRVRRLRNEVPGLSSVQDIAVVTLTRDLRDLRVHSAQVPVFRDRLE